MQGMTSSSWKRRGSSFVWSPELLGPLIIEGDATPLRTVLGWLETGFPDSPPGDRQTILVGGLQTALEAMCRMSKRHTVGCGPTSCGCARNVVIGGSGSGWYSEWTDRGGCSPITKRMIWCISARARTGASCCR